ncbi:hypothetical protein FRC14_006304 [Serendipita sp. 396]|nr:hypothetical protein FRC14_006304 [Serendipita sp. 396]KAG8860691.1 hypothetical protein FRC20_011580 [Serendipita sp. 405]
MRIGRLIRTFFALLFSAVAVRAWHNVTYNAIDPAVIYQPNTSWSYWPLKGCLSWPQGQWTNIPGTITLYFEGVAVYAYGLFDDLTNPIYMLRVDEDTPTRLGTIAPTSDIRCDPLYSKTQMVWSKHRVIFNLTNERPKDVKDLAFQGFIVTVPDPGDGITFNTNVPYSNLTSTAPGPSTTSSTSNSSINNSTNVIKILSIVGGIIFCLIAACYAWCCTRGCCSGSGTRRVSPRPFIGNQSFPLQRWRNANDNAFQPPPPPYEPAIRTTPNRPSPFPPPPPFAPTPPMPTPIYFIPPVPPMPYIPPGSAPIFSPMAPPPPFEYHRPRTSLISGSSSTSALSERRRASSVSGSSSRPLAPINTNASHTPVYNPTSSRPANNSIATSVNPVARAARLQSPPWQDSSEALD